MAEGIAACLQDHRRAVIVGERTKGKGSVQNVQEVNGYGLMYTAALFYRPNGKKLDRMPFPGRPAEEWGVTPDKGFDVPLTDAERTALREHLDSQEILRHPDDPARDKKPAFVDRQLEKALAHLRGKIR